MESLAMPIAYRAEPRGVGEYNFTVRVRCLLMSAPLLSQQPIADERSGCGVPGGGWQPPKFNLYK